MFPRHPLGRPVIGTEASIRGFERADLVGWVTEQLVAPRLLLVASGAVDADLIGRLAEARFGDMGAAAPLPLAPARFTGGERINRRAFEELLELSARFFASEEGQEGIASFREKRPARWVPTD